MFWSKRLHLLVPAISTAALITAAQQAQSQDLFGYADLHARMFANEGYGGDFLWGNPFVHPVDLEAGEEALAVALGDCKEAHGADHAGGLLSGGEEVPTAATLNSKGGRRTRALITNRCTSIGSGAATTMACG